MTQTKSISRRLLAVMLSLAMVFSLVQGVSLTASAQEGNVWATWTEPGKGAVVGQAYKDFAASQGKEAVGYDWRGDDGQVLNPNSIGTQNDPIWGCEAPCIDTSKDYTIRFTVKLEEDADSKAIDGDRPYINIDPRIADGYVTMTENWYMLDDLRQRTAESEVNGDDGVVELYRVVPKETLAVLHDAGTLNTPFEIRLQGPSANGSLENTIANDFADVEHTLTIEKIELIEGNVAPVGSINGWNSDGKYYENGQVVTNRLVYAKNGLGKSYIGADGNLVTNSWGTGEAADYYFDADGNSVKGIQTIAGKTYYFGDDYKLYKKVGVIKIDGASYSVSETGEITKITDNVDDTLDDENYNYEFLIDGTVEIDGYVGSLRELTIPSEIDGKTVTSIGANAFEWSTLTSVVIPDSVERIGDSAFYNCALLTNVTIGDRVQSIGNFAFQYCDALTSIVIPDSVTSIGNSAFCNCFKLTNVTIGTGVKSIASSAFYETGIYNNDENWENGVLYIGNYLIEARNNISGEYKIKEGTKLIGASAFYNCKSLTSIVIPDSVKSIVDTAFWRCESLTSIVIPDGVTSIGNLTFSDCTSLTSVTIGNSVESIGGEAFSGCKLLTSVKIPNSVKSIGDWAFQYCDALTSIVIPDSVTSIGNSAFHSCIKLTNVTIGDSVTSVGSGAFSDTGIYNNDENWENGVLYIGNYLIEARNNISGEYKIKEGTKVIGDWAFNNCTSLTSVVIPNSVKSIGSGVFNNCTSLTSVVIPDSVTSIGDRAFADCVSLTSIVIPDSVTSIGDTAFYRTGIYNNEENWENGALYIGDYLISVKSNITGSYQIKSDTLAIADYAFMYSSLTSVEIPDSVTNIGKDAFAYCTSLTSVVIPNSVKSIGDWAFGTCESLETVEFGGTESEWEQIEIKAYNDFLIYANIYYDSSSSACTHANKVVDYAVAPTCDKPGKTEGSHCKDCGTVIVEQKVVPAKGHTEVTDKAVAATCEKAGKTEGKHCSVCNTVIKAQTVVKAKGHSTTVKNKKSATYFAKGYSGDTVCKTCNKVIKEGKSIAKINLKKPTVKVTAGKKQFKVTYTKVSGATGFEVQYKIGKKTVTKTYSTKKTATKAIKKLAKGTYKVKVRALVQSGKKKAYSAWTKTYTLNIK